MTTDSTRILVVEDDPEVGELLLRLLRSAGYAAELAPDGQAGLHRALVGRYDALVIDRGLPAIEGLDLLGRLRRSGVEAPALILTALGAVEDRVDGLDRGAADYLVKPFDVEELLARIRAMLRPRPGRVQAALTFGAAEFDLVTRKVSVGGGEPVGLSGRESDLLRLFAESPGQVFRREEIVDRVFPDASAVALVDTYVHYLRRKLGPDVIATVRGQGYRLGWR
jgi:two-component system, OmpR family, response regulator